MTSPEDAAGILRVRLNQRFSKFPLIIYVDEVADPVEVSVDMSMTRETEKLIDDIEAYVSSRFSDFTVAEATSEQMLLCYEGETNDE
jgi:hypothetical protein